VKETTKKEERTPEQIQKEIELFEKMEAFEKEWEEDEKKEKERKEKEQKETVIDSMPTEVVVETNESNEGPK
jgi:hypothetical protein